MEAALRTVYEVVTKESLSSVEFTMVRGLEGIKEAEIDLKGRKVKVAVAHGLGNAKQLMDQIKEGKADYQFIEVMCCPGGCIGGGGQPIPTTNEIKQKRIDAIYQADVGLSLRKSHENPAVQTLYKEFLGETLGEKSHLLLHTHYTKRGKYKKLRSLVKIWSFGPGFLHRRWSRDLSISSTSHHIGQVPVPVHIHVSGRSLFHWTGKKVKKNLDGG